jgi:spore maturation protein CgeB
MSRIFCAVRHSIDPRYYYGALWSANFYPALEQLGHEIVESQVDLLPTSRFMHIPNDFTPAEMQMRADTTGQLLDEVTKEHKARGIDVFLSYFYNSHFDPAGFDELRRLGIPSINFFCNSVYQFELVRAVAAKADFAWHAERDARSRYLAVGANPIWVQMAADPTVYHPVKTEVRKRAACFVGQRYADRDRWIAGLIRNGLPVEVYGPGWKEVPAKTNGRAHEYLGRVQSPPGSQASYFRAVKEEFRISGIWKAAVRLVEQWRYRRETHKLSMLFIPHAKGPIRFEDISRIFAQYDVCLNFSNVWADGRPGSDLTPHVRLRDFEAPMCRTCYLTGENNEIHEFYEVGKEIDTYSNKDELVNKTRFYLRTPAAAEKLREAGYRRALSEHTWAHRFRELFRKTQLSDGG